MYREFFGLKSSPFNNTPDPDFFFESRSHKETLASMAYGVLEAKGFVLITGDVGSGKTLLVQALKRAVDDKHVLIEIHNPWLSAEEIQATVKSGIGLEGPVEWGALRKRLIELSEEGRRVVLLIDEAHQLPERTLEGISLLSNIETPTQKLIQIVLIGQPELTIMLGRVSLRQLQQRISLRAHLEKLNASETVKYISHRMMVAGGSPYLFSPECVVLIFHESNGIPRLINLLCDKSLLFAYGSHNDAITVKNVQDAIRAQRLGHIAFLPPELAVPENSQVANQGGFSPAAQAPETRPEPPPVSSPPLASSPAPGVDEIRYRNDEPEELFAQTRFNENAEPPRVMRQSQNTGSGSGNKWILIFLLFGVVLGVLGSRYFESGILEMLVPAKKSPPVVETPVAPQEITIPAAPPQFILPEATPLRAQPTVETPTPAPAAINAPATIELPPLPTATPNSLKMREETTSAVGQISSFSTRQYGDWNETTRDLLLAANPAVANAKSLPPGTKVLIPIITRESMVVKDAQGKFFVYFASFDKHELAKANLESVKRNFSSAELFAVDQLGVQIYRLYFGPFSNKADALAVASSVWFKYLPLLN